MKLTRPLVLLVLLGLAACRKTEQSGATAPAGGKTSERPQSGERKSQEYSRAEAVLRMPNRGSTRGGKEYAQLAKAIEDLSDPELRELLQKLHSTRNSAEDRLTYALALGQLARRDPKGALKCFTPEEMIRDEAGCTTIIPILAESSPELLKDWLINELKRADSSVQGQWLGYALGSLSSFDPAGAFEFAKTMAPGHLPNTEVILSIFSNFAKHSPQEALAAVEAYYKGSDLQYAYYNIALGVKDPAERIKIAGMIADRENRGRITSYALMQWLKTDRAAAMEKLQQLSSADLQGALGASLQDQDSLVGTLNQEDPEGFAVLLGKLMPSSSTAGIFNGAVENLAKTDPAKAMAMLQTLPEGEMKTNLFRSLFHVTARKDANAALAEAARLEDPQARARAFEGIGWVIGERGAEESLKAAAALSPADQSAFMDTAMTYVSHKDPKEAAEILATAQLHWEPETRHQWLTNVGWKLNTLDPAYTRDWLARLPEGDQPMAMKGIASDMAKSDIRGLADMLDGMPRDGKWAAGVGVLIENIKGADAKRAADWEARLREAGY